MIILGLTGSIGTGKSTVAQMFQRLNCFISSSDDIVASLYRQSHIQSQIAKLLPEDFGQITQSKVGKYVAQHPNFLINLENILHPAVKTIHLQHIQQARSENKSLIVLEIPLLFETHWQDKCDKSLLLVCDRKIQYNRVITRPGMTEEKFIAFQDRQWSNAAKKKLADFILDTGGSRLHTFQQLKDLLRLHCLNSD